MFLRIFFFQNDRYSDLPFESLKSLLRFIIKKSYIEVFTPYNYGLIVVIILLNDGHVLRPQSLLTLMVRIFGNV